MRMLKNATLILMACAVLSACSIADKRELNQDYRRELKNQGVSGADLSDQMADYKSENQTQLTAGEKAAVAGGTAIASSFLIVALILGLGVF